MHMCEDVLLGKLHESRHPIILVVHNNSPQIMRACHSATFQPIIILFN